jgi:outer membrane receptor for ferrienterochelin and colicins
MIKIVSLAALMLVSTLQAAMLNATIVNGKGQPISGANLSMLDTSLGGSSDIDGKIVLRNVPPGAHHFKLQHVGYSTRQIELQFLPMGHQDVMLVLLSSDTVLDEVIVSADNPGGLDTGGLRSIDRISAEEFKASANLLDALADVEGVDTKPCALCGSSGVGLQGLDPSYTEVQVDGLPVLSGVGALYGLEAVRSQGLASAELTRGATDARQGGGAIGGSLNLISAKVGVQDTLGLQLMLGDEFKQEVGLHLGGEVLGSPTRLLLNWSADPNRQDDDGDLLTDTPEQQRFRVKFEREERVGPVQFNWQTSYLDESRFAGNVNWKETDRGSDAVYGRDINITRAETQSHLRWKSESANYRLSAAWVHHRQDSWYGATEFNALQQRGLARLHRETPALGGLQRLEAGFTYESYNDNLELGTTTDRLFRVPHLLISQLWEPGSDFMFEGGIRTEHHEGEGVVPLLRTSLSYQANEALNFKFGAGQGFRQVHLFSLDKAVHAGFDGVMVPNDLMPEKSLSLNLTASWRHVGRVSFKESLRLFSTEFRDKAILEYSDEVGKILYANADKAWSRGIAWNQDLVFRGGYSSRMNVNFSRVRYLNTAGEWEREHMTNEWTASGRVQRSVNGTLLRLSARVFGPQNLPDRADLSHSESPIWTTWNLTLEKRLATWTVGLDVDNLFDWTQPDSPFIMGGDGVPVMDSAMIYGPLVGRRIRLRFSTGLAL